MSHLVNKKMTNYERLFVMYLNNIKSNSKFVSRADLIKIKDDLERGNSSQQQLLLLPGGTSETNWLHWLHFDSYNEVCKHPMSTNIILPILGSFRVMGQKSLNQKEYGK